MTSYFEWMGAGVYRVDERSGSMHGKQVLLKDVQFGSDGVNFYLRADFHAGREPDLPGMEARLTMQSLDAARNSFVTLTFLAGSAKVTETSLAAQDDAGAAKAVECALGLVLECRIALHALGVAAGCGLRFQFSLWRGGLPVDAVPQQGWLEMKTTNPAEMTV